MQVDPRTPELHAHDFTAMMEATHLCVLVHDAESKNILWANPAACEMLERSVDELLPLKADDMSSAAQQYDRVIGRAWLHEAVEKGSSRIEWHYRSKSGRVIPTDAHATRVELARGPAVMVQFRDIEREQQVERELRMTTSYIDALARHTSTMALMLDPTGALRFATDTAVASLGTRAVLPLGDLTDHARLRVDGGSATWQEVVDRANPVATVRLEVPREDGDPVWLEGSLERLGGPGAEALLMILHDVSERIQHEVRRAREHHQENHLARYNAMGDMAMAIAHELGQPLAAAGNYLAGAQATTERLAASADVSPAGARRLSHGLENATRQIDRSRSIVDSVRGFVGHLEHVRQAVDLNDVLEECLYFVRLRAESAGVEVMTAPSARPLRVRCERVLTGQVMLNLCFNAVDEMSACENGPRRIIVSTRAEDGSGTFTVEDHGRGLARDPFEESFTSKEQGSGIGLALSHRIITRQHGAIWASPGRGSGSRFHFSLPLAE